LLIHQKKKTILNTLKALKDNKSTLGDIIQTKISTKYGHKKGKKEHKDEFTNIKVYHIYKNDETLKNIFSEEYFHFFKKVFYKNNRKIKIKLNENENNYRVVNISEKVAMFYDLLGKDDDEKYKAQLIMHAYKYFMPNSKFIVNYD
jgi:predicted metal-dependent hydrolase